MVSYRLACVLLLVALSSSSSLTLDEIESKYCDNIETYEVS